MARSAWHHLRGYVHRPASRVGMLAVLSFAGGAAEAAVFVLVVASSARVVGNRVGTGLLSVLPDVSTPTMLLTAAAFAVVVMLLHWWSAVLTASIATEVQVVVQHRMVDAYFGATWTTQSGQSSGLLQESVTSQAGQASMYAVAALGGAGSVLQTAVLVAAAFVVDPLLAMAVVLTGAMLVGVLRPFARHMSVWSSSNVRANAELAVEVSGAARMAMELRAFGAGPAVAEHLRVVATNVGVRSERIRRLGRFARSIYRDLAMLLLIVAVYVMSSVADLDMVAFGSVVLLVVRAVNGAQSVYEAAVHCRELEPNLTEIGRRLAALESHAEPGGHLELARIDSIDARDVGYAYVPGEWAVRHLDLSLRAGEVVGVVGHSGGGKSTLVQLLTRLRRPMEGTITVNGQPYDDVTEASWTSLVALVPQEPDLMEATVADNIAFWRPGLSRDRIEEAARLAHVYDDIVQLPGGFDTMLGPDGQGLSGGQKQRVAIARALVGTPSLLVLDEPTSALDSTTESLIRDTVRSLRGAVTVIVVAHRPSTLEVCDRIVTIESGSVLSDARNVGHG